MMLFNMNLTWKLFSGPFLTPRKPFDSWRAEGHGEEDAARIMGPCELTHLMAQEDLQLLLGHRLKLRAKLAGLDRKG